MFNFKQGDNVTIGSSGNILDCIVHAAITEDFIENGTEILKSRKRGVLAPRTVRYHLEELLKYAMKKVKIRSVYLDRGFYAVPIVRMLKRLSVHFIIQAQKSIGIKKDAFRPKTTSKNYAIRLFFFFFSVSFYNLWVLVSIVLELVLNGRLPEKPLITAKMFGNLLITAYDSGG